jgi:hypothetical protein
MEIAPSEMEGRRKWLRKELDRPIILKLELPGSGDKQLKRLHETAEEVEAKQTKETLHRGQSVRWRKDDGDWICTIMGPQALGGGLDRGAHSIHENAKLAEDCINYFIREYEHKNRPIVILLKAHSRNAVAAVLIANYVQRNYGGKDPPVLVELVAFDPVPGPGEIIEPMKAKYKTELLDMAQSTIVFSRETQYDFFFISQHVSAAKRYIISAKNHKVGYHVGIIYNDCLYKGSRISLLDPGFYISTGDPGEEKPETIIKCMSPEKVAIFLDEKKGKWYWDPQKDRRMIILKIAETFFGERHEKKTVKEKPKETFSITNKYEYL